MISETKKELAGLLKKYWGHDSFRYDQEDIIQSVISGNDTLAILPTGGGKSICYQLPGIYSGKLTLVISPLIALMKDQINGLKKRGIPAVSIYSGQSKRQQDILLDNCIYGEISFLFVSPERLKSKLFIERFKKMDIGLVAIDEAHCISEWGHDFRPEYRQIAELREYKPDLTFLALTATATATVVTDLLENLGIQNANQYISSPIRPNLSYNLYEVESKKESLLNLLQRHKGCAIIYVNTRKSAMEIERFLTTRKYQARAYHGGMSSKLRSKITEQWDAGQIAIMVATKAFGMGIDKSDVRAVIHYQVPQSLEAYVQEAGRAGRDGAFAEAIILFNNADLRIFEKLMNESFPDLEYIKDVYAKVCRELQVASGAVEIEFYPFYLADFCQKYDLRKIKVFNALKLLHQSEILYLSEAILHPSQLSLGEGSTKNLLRNEDLSPKMKEFTKLLLRTYEGLFLDYCVIDEFHLSKKFDTDKNLVVKALQWLHKRGIADYKPSFHGHTISFMEYRHDTKSLPINVKAYENRKKRMQQSIDSIISYLKTDVCRQQYIAAYFSFSENDCGTCDNCINKATGENLSILHDQITELLSKGGMTIQQVYAQFHLGQRSHINEILSEMESERLISIKENKLLLN